MITLKDIAKIAGVDKSTVSRVINGEGRISEKTRTLILRIAKENGYLPNESAKVLAGKSARTIGIILPEIDCNYYAGVVSAIEQKLKENGFSLIIGQTGFLPENEISYIKLFLQKKVDGIILDIYNTSKFLSDIESITHLLTIPLVFIETDVITTKFDVIQIDNFHGVKLAISHLAECGARSIGYITETLSAPVRLPAYIKAMKECGIRYHEKYVRTGVERLEQGGYLRMNELLSSGDLPDAVFASYDTMAQGALKAISEAGLNVPRDILIAGFDNIRESCFFNPPLTTIAPPTIHMGELAVKRLLERISNGNSMTAKHYLLQPELVIRNTTLPVKGDLQGEKTQYK